MKFEFKMTNFLKINLNDIISFRISNIIKLKRNMNLILLEYLIDLS